MSCHNCDAEREREGGERGREIKRGRTREREQERENYFTLTAIFIILCAISFICVLVSCFNNSEYIVDCYKTSK